VLLLSYVPVSVGHATNAELKATVEVGHPAESNMKTRSDQTLIHDLRELIAALDHRVPHLERDGEREIARDAQALRRAALARITELEQPSAAQAVADVARENA